jgi:cysteine sulfinate desulfinase/cysteine desulfurase-like protein
VLLALGQRREEIEGSIRLSLGWTNTDEEVKRAADVIQSAVCNLRAS